MNLEDFLGQLQQLKRMGPLENLLGMLPGMGKMPNLSGGESEVRRVEAIIRSMTPAERRRPEILNASRRERIARGSGTSVAAVNDLIKQFGMMKRMMKEMGKMQKAMARRGILPKLAR
jgi:signal recognition particle subunit SRP54